MVAPMSTRRYHIVDVFAEAKYTGNQLAVVTEAAGLSAEDMQRIAREMNFSETTFLLSNRERDGGFDVRIFTPAVELPFAGHPTIGTACVIQREILGAGRDRIVLNLPIGPVPVTVDAQEVWWMHPRWPDFGPTRPAADAAELLRLSPADLDPRLPVEQVGVGVSFLIVPLRGLDAVRRCRLDGDVLARRVAQGYPMGVLAFAPETYRPENHVNARMFFDAFGVREDPATGSAGACLAAYTARHRCFGTDSIALRVEQGYEIERPSLLHLRATAHGDAGEVSVGGRVLAVARGELL